MLPRMNRPQIVDFFKNTLSSTNVGILHHVMRKITTGNIKQIMKVKVKVEESLKVYYEKEPK